MLGKSKVKYIQSLGQKKLRDEEGLFIAEGPKIIAELLLSGYTHIHGIYALKEWLDDNAGKLKNIAVTEVTEAELAKISQLSTPHQVVAVLKQWKEPVITARDHITIALDGIQDPGNLGTILRIADWFGVQQVVCSRDCADRYNPKVVQSTMGSITRVNVFYTDLTSWLAKQEGIAVYGALLNGEDVAAINKIKEGIIVIGNESKGISSEILNLVTKSITIPQKGKAESLNAAVATGIILSHLI